MQYKQMSETNTVTIPILLILLAAIHGSVAQNSYSAWLKQQDANILTVPQSAYQDLWEIPLDVEVISRLGSEKCVPANQPYCDPSGEPSGDDICPTGSRECPAVECTTMEELSLQDHETSFDFVTHPSSGSQPVTTSLQCGLDVQTNALLFTDHVQVTDQPPCNFSFVQPGINVNVSSINQTATISFTIEPTTGPFSATFLKVSALESSGINAFSTVLSIQSGGITNTTNFGLQVTPDITHLKEFGDETSFAVVLIGNVYAIFANGEIAMTVTGGRYPIEQMMVEFGSSSYRGSIEDITMYNVAASSNELYSIYTGLPPAKNLIKPDCTCPRAYTDSFGLVYLEVNQFSNGVEKCSEPSQNMVPRLGSLQRYTNIYHGKWSMFTYDGWVSDFTDEVEIIIRMSQPMLIYGVSGFLDSKLPSAIEVRILGPSDEERAVVYLSHNCEEKYGLISGVIPQFVTTVNRDGPIFPGERFRRDINVVEPKCYSMDDGLSSYSESYDGMYPEGIDQIPRDLAFGMPILGPNEGGLLLSDSFSGSVSIKLIGHEETGENMNWYYLSQLSLSARPHCGGYNYTLVGSPKTMSEYYNFYKPNARAYSCQCPQGITGDMCESCSAAPGIYRYMKEPGVCADCDCSDLTRENAQQCDRTTGQCDCKKDPDLDLAGRQCHWYIDEIGPLYGPIAGGTKVTIKGEYLSGFAISYVIAIAGQPAASKEPDDGGKDIKFTTIPYHTANTSVDLVVGANTTLDVGPLAKFFAFQYKPDPILKDIESRTTILRGGTTVTAIGEFFDSVFAPEMIVYLRQNDQIIERYPTTCDVINSTVMLCPTPPMNEEAEPLLDGEIAPVPSATEGPSSTTTYSTSTGSTASTGSTGSTASTGSAGRENGLQKRSVRWVSSRTKRASNSQEVNDNYLNKNNNVDFTLGFVYDGLEDYKDLEMSGDDDLRDLSRLYVYDDPEIEPFEENPAIGNKVLEFNPKKQRSIFIGGTALDYGVKLSDYEIEIGVESCEVIDLTSNQITCRAPDVQPDPKDGLYEFYNNKEVPAVKLKAGGYTASVGYIYYTSNIWNDNEAFRISMIVLIVVVCLAILGLVVFFLVKKYRKQDGISTTPDNMDDPSTRYVKRPGHEDEVRLWFPGRKLDANIQACVDRCKIPQERLTVGKQLGKGNFGLVYKGQLMTPSGNLRTVAIKSLKDEKEMSFEDMENFLAEGTLMIDFKHENVLSLVGVVAEEGERPLVVLPYMDNGDLCTFIKKDDLELVLADMLHFALQIANGMSYLAKERFVHRDLAARNCMVDGSYIVKIADFGMSRDVYEKDYYKMESMNKPLPMKWMAVESLSEGRYTSKSDVWSYGITLWELLTRGSSPYPGVNNYYIKEYVGTGKRLDKPSICPPIIYDMMCKCWEEDPENRPTFDEISDFVGKLLKGETIPTAGSDEAAGYYYARNATKHIPDDYLDVEAIIENEDYIIALPEHPAPVTTGTNTPTKSNTSTPTPAKRLHVPVVNEYANTEQMVEIYE